MALNAYLRLTGEVQGEIKGSVTQAGREDSIYGCWHLVTKLFLRGIQLQAFQQVNDNINRCYYQGN